MSEELNLGPLNALIGKWRGSSGKDIAPEPDDVENNDYYEELEFRVVGDVENALEQCLTIVQYELTARRVTNNNLLHHQVGYWTWDEKDNSVCNSFSIGRRVAVLAMGKVIETDTNTTFEVRAEKQGNNPSIVESPFMVEKASTQSFMQTMVLEGDTLSYQQVTHVDIYGQKSFKHSDTNSLTRVK